MDDSDSASSKQKDVGHCGGGFGGDCSGTGRGDCESTIESIPSSCSSSPKYLRHGFTGSGSSSRSVRLEDGDSSGPGDGDWLLRERWV